MVCLTKTARPARSGGAASAIEPKLAEKKIEQHRFGERGLAGEVPGTGPPR